MHGTAEAWTIDVTPAGAGRCVAMPPAAADPAPEERGERFAPLHAFHRGEAGAASRPDLASPGDDFIPALLHAYRDPSVVRNDYPLLLLAPVDAEDERLCVPLSEGLKERIERFAPGADDARILKDNLAPPGARRALRARWRARPDARAARPGRGVARRGRRARARRGE